MFASVYNIAIAATVLCLSSLTEENVGLDELQNKKVPIRVTITPRKKDVEIQFAFVHDHPESHFGEPEQASMLLHFDHATVGRIRTPIATREEIGLDDTNLTTGYIVVTPDIAKSCRVEIYVGPARFKSLVEHRYRIELSLFAQELKTK